MELDLLITELDETTIQIDKMRYLTTQISTKAGEKRQSTQRMLFSMILKVRKLSNARLFFPIISKLRMQQLKRQLARWQNTIPNFRQEILKNLLQKLWWMML